MIFRILFVSVFFIFISPFYAIEVPEFKRPVTDLAGILSETTINDLEKTLYEHEKETSNQVAILTLSSLEGESIEEVAIQVFDVWKLGQKSKNNGILFLIAPNDRKMRIEVGRGLEGALTDIQTKQIIRNEVRPKFKEKDMDGGVVAGTNAILASIRGEYTPSETDVNTRSSEPNTFETRYGLIMGSAFTFISLFVAGAGGFIFTFIGLFILFKAFVMLFGKILAWFFVLGIFWIIYLLKKNIGWGDGGSSGGGGWYGGGWSSGDWSSGGGSDSWSGGGGDSGGGGASGDW